MSRRQGLGSRCALVLLLASACAQVRPEPDFAEARRLVRESTGSSEAFDPYAEVLTEAEVRDLLAGGLALEEAQRLALLYNRELRAEFLEIGIAHADWVQSRLPSNPSLDVLWRLPTGGGRSMLEAILGIELLESWRLPLRGKSARKGLDAAVLRVARRAGEHLAAVRTAYFAAVAEEELRLVAEEHVALVGRSYAAVQELRRAGVADALDESLARGPLLAAQLDLRTARLEADTAKRDLARTLSVEWPVADLRLTDPLPEPAPAPLEPEPLVALALRARLDLRSLTKVIESLETRVELERRRAFGDAAAGPALERPAESGDSLLGGSLSLTLPLFDQNQARVARAEFELHQMRQAYEGARVTVAQDVRTAVDRSTVAAEVLRSYRSELIPQAERSLELAQASYSAGRATLFVLLEAQRGLLEARRARVVAAREAAWATAALERALGCRPDDRSETSSGP